MHGVPKVAHFLESLIEHLVYKPVSISVIVGRFPAGDAPAIGCIVDYVLCTLEQGSATEGREAIVVHSQDQIAVVSYNCSEVGAHGIYAIDTVVVEVEWVELIVLEGEVAVDIVDNRGGVRRVVNRARG